VASVLSTQCDLPVYASADATGAHPAGEAEGAGGGEGGRFGGLVQLGQQYVLDAASRLFRPVLEHDATLPRSGNHRRTV
jgi:hypothetical protein